MRVGHKGRGLVVRKIRGNEITDLESGPYLFIQTRANKNKYYAPGMQTVTEDWVNDLAQKNGWSVRKVVREKRHD